MHNERDVRRSVPRRAFHEERVFDRVRVAGLLPAALLLLSATAADAQRPDIPFEVGQPFPDLTLPSAEDGKPLSIRDFRGRKVVLHVFASW